MYARTILSRALTLQSGHRRKGSLGDLIVCAFFKCRKKSGRKLRDGLIPTRASTTTPCVFSGSLDYGLMASMKGRKIRAGRLDS